MKHSKLNAFNLFLFSFFAFIFVFCLLFFLGDFFNEHIPKDRQGLFGRVMGILMFSFGASSIIFGAYCMFKKFKLI